MLLSEMSACFAEVAAPIRKLWVLKECTGKPMSMRMAVNAELKWGRVRALL